ncbi:esterase-like activity of phytase family protein [Imhoffiella purpurea]|uniref:Alkaline phosphatase n=1 Tax=Imhoffiella purpurea TaxID=1249627 RepID=W9V956_9GAMM|nr:esterase-like activity of phytase family protein [Imhoffiella purpurea]EXJ12612.1 Alkaline phosphatase [Imhoffiella purpurea]
MQSRTRGILLTSMLAAGMAGYVQADTDSPFGLATANALGSHDRIESFRRIATLGNYRNLAPADIGEETVSEIVAATKNGKTLVYTDSPGEAIGFVDISDPSKPSPLGRVDMGGEPTSVEVIGNLLALVAVNTSEDFVDTGGRLIVVNIPRQTIVGWIELGGQPDSIKLSPKDDYAAVVIENERDEDVTVDGVEGGLPQSPAGYLAIVDIQGTDPSGWDLRRVELTGLASYGSSDPEPEFVDVNSQDQAVVSLQENNHLVVVDLPTGAIVRDFDLGTVDLTRIDATEDGIISLTESLDAVPREPDAIAWVPLDLRRTRHLIATANEGDLFGGSRGFSLFDPEAKLDPLVYDSGSSFEAIAVRHGHYPEERSENKGSEPEAVEFGRFGRDDYLFVGSERGSFVAVYAMEDGEPRFTQLLPGPLGPEGLLAIPSRNLLVASGEEDDPEYGVRSSIMIYELGLGYPTYPQILSADDANGSPIPWSALSGMVADPKDPNRLYAVWDSFFSESRILTIDVSGSPAVITDAMTIRGGTGNYDPEGIAIAPDGSFWIASEGNKDDSRPNRLLQVSADTGEVLQEIGLPEEILACRAASESTATLGSGFEGLAVQATASGYRLLVAQQRGWDYSTAACEDLDDDAGGLDANGQPRRARLWTYDQSSGDWGHIAWELSNVPERASWVGLSEISATPSGSYILIERDNRTGDFTEIKNLVEVNAAAMTDGLVSASEKSAFDLIPELEATNGWITDKPEGVAVTGRGVVYLVTDNDGVDDWSGETWFLNLGYYRNLFR